MQIGCVHQDAVDVVKEDDASQEALGHVRVARDSVSTIVAFASVSWASLANAFV